MSILKVENVIKRFGTYAASNNISFEVEPGKVFGLLGPNGAGKTTMIRMITNILMPDEGRIMLFGEKVSFKTQNFIGYLPEERGLYKKLKVLDQLVYFARLKGMTAYDASVQAKYWLAKTGAAGWENKKVQELSKGMQQKVQFITTLLHDPDFIILDEPFSGFDPINTELLKNIILELKEKGKTIILSTHVMAQVEEMCDDIAMINKGSLVLSGSVREIKNSYGRNNVILEYDGNADFLDDIEGIEIVNKNQGKTEFKIISNQVKPNDLVKMIADRTQIIKFELAMPSMHEIFIDVVARQEKK